MRFKEFKIIKEAPGEEIPAKKMAGLDVEAPPIKRASDAEI